MTTALLALMLFIPMLFPNSSPDLAHTVASYLFIPYPDTQGRFYPLLVPGWTLTFEMIFYAVFAGLIALRDSRLIPVLTAVFASYIIGVGMLASDNRLLNWLANPMMFEFVFGCFVARAYLAYRARPAWLVHALVAAALILFSASILVEFPLMLRTLVWGVPAMLLVAAAAFAGGPAGTIRQPRKAFAALGDASYSLYLVHPFVLPAIAKLWRVLGLDEHLHADLYVITATVASAGLALCTYYIIERPLGLALVGRRKSSSTRSSFVAAGRIWRHMIASSERPFPRSCGAVCSAQAFYTPSLGSFLRCPHRSERVDEPLRVRQSPLR